MSTQLIPVPFRGTTLFVVDHAGQPYTPMKPIVEGMGLSWQGQHEKLNINKARWGIRVILIPSEGGNQEAVCLPLRKLPGWLMTLHPNKVKPEIRESIIAYQNECDEVLWQYWTQSRPAALPDFDDEIAAAEAFIVERKARRIAEREREEARRELEASRPKVIFHDQVVSSETLMDFVQMFSLLQHKTGQRFTRASFIVFARRHGFACQPNPHSGITSGRFVPRRDYIGTWFVSEMHSNGVTEWMVRPMALAGIVALIEIDRSRSPFQANSDEEAA